MIFDEKLFTAMFKGLLVGVFLWGFAIACMVGLGIALAVHFLG